ncbi:MAG: hypothetical protein C5S48_06280 [Candidatus Methanogaster sp.]|nr:MAG: hypothetical protein C5S48_06280 [ANME-2 cluster archaeon]
MGIGSSFTILFGVDMYPIWLGVPKMRLAITNIYQNDPFKSDDQHPESRL